MSRSKRRATAAHKSPVPPRWKGQESLSLVYQLNERGLQLLSEAISRGTSVWPELAVDKATWSKVEAGALRRAARLPFVLVDARFADEAWWQSISKDPELVAGTCPECSVWPAQAGRDLMSELLMLAWHMVRLDNRAARLTLGMRPGAAASIAALTPQHIGRIASLHARVLKLRWQNDPGFWSQLLTSARIGDERALSEMHLHAKLRFSGALNTLSTVS